MRKSSGQLQDAKRQVRKVLVLFGGKWPRLRDGEARRWSAGVSRARALTLSLDAELVAVLEIKRDKHETAEASKQELVAQLVTLASEAKAQVKEAGELRTQLDEIALVLECVCDCLER